MTPAPTLPIKIPKKQPENVPWSELPFAEEGPEPDLEDQPKGVQVGIRQEKRKKIQEFHLGFYRQTNRFHCETIGI